MDFFITFLELLAQVLALTIFMRFILTAVGVDPYNPLLVFLRQITDPVIAPFRGIIPPVGMFDFSPLIPLIILQVIARILASL